MGGDPGRQNLARLQPVHLDCAHVIMACLVEQVLREDSMTSEAARIVSKPKQSDLFQTNRILLICGGHTVHDMFNRLHRAIAAIAD